MKQPEIRKLQPVRPKFKDTNFSSYEKARLVYLYKLSDKTEEFDKLDEIRKELSRTYKSVLRESKIRREMRQI